MRPIYAALAEKERRMISESVRAVLLARERQGVWLGRPATLTEAGRAGAVRTAEQARRCARNVAALIHQG